jgi:hypothetical protein
MMFQFFYNYRNGVKFVSKTNKSLTEERTRIWKAEKPDVLQSVACLGAGNLVVNCILVRFAAIFLSGVLPSVVL